MIVVDTNVVSELMRPSPSPAVVAWVRARSATELCTTSITVAEVLHGLRRLPGGRRKDALEAAAKDVFSAFADRLLGFDAAAAAEYATVVHARERDGTPIDGFDAQIAAVCRVRRATLVTRNVKDFRGTGIEIVDPWRDVG